MRISKKSPAPGPSRPRGRPRAYNPDDALQRAMSAFWRNGYSGTTLDAIAEATEMNRPSLYAAFGDKQTLYQTTLARYVQGGTAAIAASLDPAVPLQEGLSRAYGVALDLYCPKGETPLGCYLICTATAEAVNDAEIRAELKKGMRGIDRAFENRFRAAQVTHELSANIDPIVLSRVASSIIHSLALRSRAGDARAELEATVKQAIALLCGIANSSP